MADEKQELRELTFNLRVCVMMFVIFIIFSILCLQLWNTQVLNWRQYEDKAQEQSVRRIRIPPVRGNIFSSDGKKLAANRASWDVHLHLSEMRQKNRRSTVAHILAESERVAKSIGRENTLTAKRVEQHMNHYPAISMPLFRDLTPEELLQLWELSPRINGLEIVQTPVRIYPYDSLAIHLIGYTRQQDPKAAKDRGEFNYYLPDMVGISGLEKICDSALLGQAGSELVMVNSMGFVSDVLERNVTASAGKDVYLTLDLSAQQIAEDLLKDLVGAIVVIDSASGAVVAMASSPAYSLADFASKDRYKQLLEDKNKPFLNRATMGAYMPGSVIKPLTALAAFYNGVTAEETVNCTGSAPYGYRRRIHCNKRAGHGEMDLPHAIKHSCNVYFIEQGMAAGIDILSYVYATAGLGRKTGIEIPEVTGYLPANGPRWNKNETAYVSFGQGKIEVTPIQVALYFAALANGGTLWKPYLVDRIVDRNGAVEQETAPQQVGTLSGTQENFAAIRQGMYMVVNENGGSGVRGKMQKSILYGKTGTADVEQEQKDTKHVWFAGFSEHPVTKKTYSIAVVIENGESGGKTSAPIAGAFFDRWFPAPPAQD